MAKEIADETKVYQRIGVPSQLTVEYGEPFP